MQSLVDIRKVIYDWAYAQNPFQVTLPVTPTIIWANQDGPRPDKPYVLLNIISGVNQFSSNAEMVMPVNGSSSDQRILSTHGELTLSVNIYAEGFEAAFDAMHRLLGSLLSDVVRAELKRRHTTTIEVTTPQDFTVYTITINGVAISITSDATATNLEIRDALVTAVNANSFVSVVAWDIDPIAETPLPDDELIINASSGCEYVITVSSLLTITDEVKAVDLAYLRNNGVTDLTQLLETDFEGRAQADITFAIPLRIFDDPGIIETVEITNNIDGSTITIGA